MKKWKNKLPNELHQEFELMLEPVLQEAIEGMKSPTEKTQPEPEQPKLNEIERAYHNYEPIRYKKWEKFQWIKKHSEFEAKTENGAIFNVVSLNFNTHPQLWELYTEPTEQRAKPFDKERFEAMFRAVVASGVEWEYDNIFGWITDAIKKLDAYYASKEGGNND